MINAEEVIEQITDLVFGTEDHALLIERWNVQLVEHVEIFKDKSIIHMVDGTCFELTIKILEKCEEPLNEKVQI